MRLTATVALFATVAIGSTGELIASVALNTTGAFCATVAYSSTVEPLALLTVVLFATVAE